MMTRHPLGVWEAMNGGDIQEYIQFRLSHSGYT